MQVSERRFHRVPYDAQVMLEHSSGQGTAARTVDLSEGGMRVRASRPLREGARLRCRVKVGSTPWVVDGRVVWAERAPGLPREGGIEFTGVASKTWTGLRASVAVRHTDPSEADRERLHVRRAPDLTPIEAIPVDLGVRSAKVSAKRAASWWRWIPAMALGVAAAALAWAVGPSLSQNPGHAPHTPVPAASAGPTENDEPEVDASPSDRAERGPLVDIAGDHTVVILPLSSGPERVHHYPLAEPDGVALEIWGAAPAFAEGHHPLDGGRVPSVTARVGPARSHIRVFWSGGVPKYELTRRDSALELRIAH